MNTYKWAMQAIKHPIDFFYDFSEWKDSRKKLINAAVIIFLAIAAKVISILITGFALQTQEPQEVSILVEAIWIIVPWLTWSVSNWGISTIADGEGKFLDILTSSAFVLVPFIPLSLAIAGVSNLMTLNFDYDVTGNPNSMYIAMLVAMFLWVLLLLFLHVKVLHDFEFKKTFGVIILSVIGMFVIWFVGLLLFGLVNQAINFVITVYKEIMFRM